MLSVTGPWTLFICILWRVLSSSVVFTNVAIISIPRESVITWRALIESSDWSSKKAQSAFKNLGFKSFKYVKSFDSPVKEFMPKPKPYLANKSTKLLTEAVLWMAKLSVTSNESLNFRVFAYFSNSDDSSLKDLLSFIISFDKRI